MWFYKNISDTTSNSTYYYILTLFTGLVTLIINVPIKNTHFSQLVYVDPSIVNPLWVNWFFKKGPLNLQKKLVFFIDFLKLMLVALL